MGKKGSVEELLSEDGFFGLGCFFCCCFFSCVWQLSLRKHHSFPKVDFTAVDSKVNLNITDIFTLFFLLEQHEPILLSSLSSSDEVLQCTL